MDPKDAVQEASRRLDQAAKAYAAAVNTTTWGALCQSAEAFSKARKVVAPSTGLTMPFGKSRGTPLEQCTEKDLQYLVGVLEESIDDVTKERWREKNLQLLEGARTELASR